MSWVGELVNAFQKGGRPWRTHAARSQPTEFFVTIRTRWTATTCDQDYVDVLLAVGKTRHPQQRPHEVHLALGSPLNIQGDEQTRKACNVEYWALTCGSHRSPVPARVGAASAAYTTVPQQGHASRATTAEQRRGRLCVGEVKVQIELPEWPALMFQAMWQTEQLSTWFRK